MLNKGFFFTALAVLAGIVYVSLFPFRWREALPEWGPLTELARTWREWPESRGDFIANVFLYLPWGLVGALALSRRSSGFARIVIVTLIGALLSFAMESAQFYIAERFTDMRDIYANTLGSALGAGIALCLGGELRSFRPAEMRVEPVALLLLGVFLAARLYPFVPVIDLHKYIAAIRPLYRAASLPAGDIFVRGAIWLFLADLVDVLFGRRGAAFWFVLIAAVVFAGRVMIVDASLNLADVVACLIAFGVWFFALRFLPGRAAALALLFASVVVLERLEPFRLSPHAHGFSWLPFADLLRGTPASEFLALLDKFLLYGAFIWLMTEAGLRLRRAVATAMVLLFFCSLVEMYLPGRSAGISETVMALVIGIVMRGLAGSRRQVPLPA